MMNHVDSSSSSNSNTASSSSSSAAPATLIEANKTQAAQAQEEEVEEAAVSGTTYRQLLDRLNQLTLDLQGQEDLLLEEARRVKAIDQSLECNGKRVSELKSAAETVKIRNEKTEHAIAFLIAQQNEMKSVLSTLECSFLKGQPEPARTHLSELTTFVNAELVQIAGDLQHLVQEINDWNRSNWSGPSNPIVQILKVLNEHTDALQWAENTCLQLRESLIQ